MAAEEPDAPADDGWDDPDFEEIESPERSDGPDIADIDDQLARNETYIFQLEQAGHRLRGASLSWYLSAAIFLMIAVFMMAASLMVTGPLTLLPPQGILGETLWNTAIVLFVAAAIGCFIRSLFLRQLLRDAWEAAQFNRHVVQSVRDRLERAR